MRKLRPPLSSASLHTSRESTKAVTRALVTRLAHAGCVVDPATGALTPPIHPSSTFERDGDLTYPRGFIYARTSNPTRHLLESCLADIETPLGCDPGEALAFSSGAAAAAAVFQALPNGHIILPDDVYHGNRTLLTDIFSDWGLRFSRVDFTQLDELERAIAAAKGGTTGEVAVWAETPSNPLCKVTDIAAVAAIWDRYDSPLIVDATWLTPVICQPILLGADMVVHSCTKYLGGHSDLTAGALVCSSKCSPRARKLYERAQVNQTVAGAVPSAFDCWLILRGLRSLASRMRLHCENALAVALFLSRHKRVAKVHFPGLPNHAGHDTMRRQQRSHAQHAWDAWKREGGAGESTTSGREPPVSKGGGDDGLDSHCVFGGMLSFEVDGDEKDTVDVVASTELFRRATSLGGTESLIEHRRSIEGANTATPANLIRLSVGLEDPADLIADLAAALDRPTG